MRQLSFALFSWFVFSSCVAKAGPNDPPQLPSGFTATKISTGLDSTGICALPDGRILVGEKSGKISLVKDNVMQTPPMLTVKEVETNNEQGLESLCAHPDFAKNGWIYMFYTVRGKGFNRIARYTLKGDTCDGEETVIYETDRCAEIHNGGALCFGIDGKLFIGSGEVKTGGGAQQLNSTQGKVLRINDDGSAPKDNPFLKETQGKYQAIYAIGVRQPFKGAVQPGTGKFFLNVVSNGGNEAIFWVKPGENYGWDKSEGYPREKRFVSPILAYGPYGNCITGGAFCSGKFPKQYIGKYFFMDFLSNNVWTLDPAAASPKDTVEVFAKNMNRPVDLCFAPDGTLYLLTRGDGQGNTFSKNGSLWYARYTGDIPPAKIIFVSQPQNTYPGLPFPKPIAVAVQDAQGNTLPMATCEVSLSLSGKGTSSLKTAEPTEGIASFTDLALAEPGKNYTLTATAKGLPPATSAPFEIFAKAAKPQIQPSSGKFTGPVTVRLVSPMADTEIHYTTDGTPVTSSSPLYKEPFQVAATQKIRAIVTKKGLTESDALFADYTISGDKAYGMPFRPDIANLNLPANAKAKAPATLQETGVFQDLAKLQPQNGFVPYHVNSPLWSDGAQKLRWVGLPSNGKIKFNTTGEWTFPAGTVFIKHFQIATSTEPLKRLETRLLIVDATGKNGFGLTYKWRPDNSNADLVAENGADETLTVPTADGGTSKQVWHYPGRNECLTCHTANAGFVLGANTRQLNGPLTYPGTRAVDNQIRTWSYLDMFSNAPAETQIAGFTQLVNMTDPQATLENRVRSYFDSNCSQCHRPGGVASNFDARYDTPLNKANVINGNLRNDLNMRGSKVVVPTDLTKSMLYLRMISDHQTQRMPPLARNVKDDPAIKMVEEWIKGMDSQGKPAALK